MNHPHTHISILKWSKRIATSLIATVAVILFAMLFVGLGKATATSPVKFAALGDFGATSDTTDVLERVAIENPAFLLGLGDYTYGDLDEPDWCDFVTDSLGSIPFQLGIGNHDDRDEASTGHGDIEQLADCFTDQMSSDGNYPTQYAFDAGAARVIVTKMDIDLGGTEYTYWPEPPTSEFTWLDNEIDTAQANGQWVIVMTHKNCITASDNAPYCEIRKKLMNYLLTEEVDLVLQGHFHGYGRSKQLKLNTTTCVSFSVAYDEDCHKLGSQTNNHTTFNSGSGTLFAINGTGGKNLLPYDSAREEIPYFAKKWASNLNPKFGVTTVLVEDNKLTVKYIRTTGETDDNFTINR